MKKYTMDGNEACANGAYLLTELAGIYPITPSSPMAEHIDEWASGGRLNVFNDRVKVVEMESEAGAAGFVHGALNAGCLTTTFTASQGLLLMIPNMYKIAGEMLPATFHVAARSLSTQSLSIFGDHQDVYAVRSTGFNILASSSVQDAAYLSVVAELSAIKSSLPMLHFFDGFRTSHELQKVNVLEATDIKDIIPVKELAAFRERSLNPAKPYTIGTASNDDIYFQQTEARNQYYKAVPDIVNDYMQSINKISHTNYAPFNYYGASDATYVIVAMGSVCETIKETIDDLITKHYKVGLIEVHLYRPFSAEYLKAVLPTSVTSIAVLDRTKETGSAGPLYLDTLEALKELKLTIVGGRYGLSSKNTTPRDIKATYEMLAHPQNNFTLSINDDVTKTSLATDPDYKTSTSDELMIYGYGSDGMVSASKSIIKIIGDNTNKEVQGYFQYDSKKSGGVTIAHLRFNNQPIRSTYYVENPSVICVTKDTYLNKFDTYSNLKKNGIYIVNTNLDKDTFVKQMDANLKLALYNKQAKVYIIDALDLAQKLGLKNKISMIMESAIMSMFDIIDYDLAKNKMIDYAQKTFFKKGPEVFEANKQAIELAASSLVKIELDNEVSATKTNQTTDVFSMIEHRLGDQLPVSAFKPNGIYLPGTSALEKRGVADFTPEWIGDNCTQCSLCSIVCPHGAIRPFLLSEAEYQQAPDSIKKRCLEPIEVQLKHFYYFCIAISVKDCTGCNSCLKTCPGKMNHKALMAKPLNECLAAGEQDVFDYLVKNVTAKDKININTVKGSQLQTPQFCFSGACGGCGETPYLKLLTQLLGDHLIIANATGCSSIYGASMPSTPYSVPWASSLFEDNAEYGYGILIANKVIQNRIVTAMQNNMNTVNAPLFKEYLANINDYKITSDIAPKLSLPLPETLETYKNYLASRTIWTIGGDGWAYDIGYGGIDHVLASNDDVNILVLNTEVYSNTGGQASKATGVGAIAEFASLGKQAGKKDLARMAMAYPNVYVAQTSLGYNPMQTIKCIMEAVAHHGPSIIIAYAPCIAHGIKGGMENGIMTSKNATSCGYFPVFRRNPDTKTFSLDSNANFDLYEDFLMTQTRYALLKEVNKDNASALLNENKREAIERFQYYQSLVK